MTFISSWSAELDYRRIFVSNPRVAGRTLAFGELNLPKVIGAVVTRVRRGDADMIARGDMRLELGDRVRVIARREDLAAAAKFFGDSYRALSEVDVLTFPIRAGPGRVGWLCSHSPAGGITLRPGHRGRTAARVGWPGRALERSGRWCGACAYNANLTLRQFGLVLSLAGLGRARARSRPDDRLRRCGRDRGGRRRMHHRRSRRSSLLATRCCASPMGRLIGILAAIMTQPGLPACRRAARRR
ncbi:MAG: hypothetical protein IPO29_10700 [Anaerolineae bacterium]|nr:hypothetical protein [Anaerolineae bacterium]